MNRLINRAPTESALAVVGMEQVACGSGCVERDFSIEQMSSVSGIPRFLLPLAGAAVSPAYLTRNPCGKWHFSNQQFAAHLGNVPRPTYASKLFGEDEGGIGAGW